VTRIFSPEIIGSLSLQSSPDACPGNYPTDPQEASEPLACQAGSHDARSAREQLRKSLV
jgi:hypothetical protein